MPVRFSTVSTMQSGPPWASELLILPVPAHWLLTHESRGNPRIEARFFFGLIPMMWIESPRPRAMAASLSMRESLPIARTKMGLPSVSSGV